MRPDRSGGGGKPWQRTAEFFGVGDAIAYGGDVIPSIPVQGDSTTSTRTTSQRQTTTETTVR